MSSLVRPGQEVRDPGSPASPPHIPLCLWTPRSKAQLCPRKRPGAGCPARPQAQQQSTHIPSRWSRGERPGQGARGASLRRCLALDGCRSCVLVSHHHGLNGLTQALAGAAPDPEQFPRSRARRWSTCPRACVLVESQDPWASALCH